MHGWQASPDRLSIERLADDGKMRHRASTNTIVITGLDPVIHQNVNLFKKMDCRVKPGNDTQGASRLTGL
ncbi:MAG: hypothetical protein CL533_12995 [Afipia sp.]|nr:hypothetical protein [Afipia sp.]OUX60684.1 MAG: hypothetical protein CBB64_12950 [Afipia sp. TMED4]HBF55278.1 hypothetical protein [Afipia sp.]HCX18739.1 hypothetical protein [Afipia sp.]